MCKNTMKLLNDYSQSKELVLSPSFECLGLVFNVTNPIFKNKNIRLALALAIDREKLLAKMGKNKAFAAYSFVPLYDKKYNSMPLFKQDIQLARKLLEASGYTSRKKLPPVGILCNTLDLISHTTILEEIQKDWKNFLEIDSFIEDKGIDSFFAHRKKANFDIIKVSFGSFYNPTSIIHLFTSQNPHNYGRWADPTYDAILAQINKTTNKKKLRRLTRDAELYLIDEMPVIPLFFNSHSFLVRKRLRGWFPNPMNMHPLKFVYFAH
jgi:ABC-type oligopeptide transport system substrate-binding subunit